MDCHLRTLAGPEIGVASTKAFTTQLATLACLVVGAAQARGRLSAERERELTQALDEVPARAAEVLLQDHEYERIAHELVPARDVLYIGRGTATRSRSKARSSSRRSATSTPRATPPASSSTARSR